MNIDYLEWKVEDLSNGKLFKIYPLEGCWLIDHLQNDFMLVALNSEQYLASYKYNGFLNNEETIVDWETSLFITNNFVETDVVLLLSQKVSDVKTGESALEFIAKMRSFINYYEFVESEGKYISYSNFNNSFADTSLIIDFEIKDSKVDCGNEINDFKIIYSCAAKVRGRNKHSLLFDIMCYSPVRVYRESMSFSGFFSPHLVCSRFDNVFITTFLLHTLNTIKASSVDELKIKLTTFSRSFEEKDLLTKVVTKGLVHTFKLRN